MSNNKLIERIRQKLKGRQFENDVKAIRKNIFKMLKHYNKVKAEYYTEEEKTSMLKNLRQAEKSINEIFKKK